MAVNGRGQGQDQAVATVGAPRLPMPAIAAEQHKLDLAQWGVLVDAIFPSARTPAAVCLALNYCKARNLDIFKKPVHIVPMWDSKKRCEVETIWPGIAEIRTTAARTNLYAGRDETKFGPMRTEVFRGIVTEWEDGVKNEVEKDFEVTFPEWAELTVYKIVGGVRCAFTGPKVFWLEAYATHKKSDIPNEMWRSRPCGQLDKCAEAASLRAAFPEEIGGQYTAEEMEGKSIVIEDPTPDGASRPRSKSGVAAPGPAAQPPPAANPPASTASTSATPPPAASETKTASGPAKAEYQEDIVGIVETSAQQYQGPPKKDPESGKMVAPPPQRYDFVKVRAADGSEFTCSCWSRTAFAEVEKARDAGLALRIKALLGGKYPKIEEAKAMEAAEDAHPAEDTPSDTPTEAVR